MADDSFAYTVPDDRQEEVNTLIAGLRAQGKTDPQIGARVGRLQYARKNTDPSNSLDDWMAGRLQQRQALDEFFRSKAAPPQQLGEFDTKLPPDQEAVFQVWKKQYAPRDSGADYDLRGAFKAGLKPDPKTGHWSDQFKKPNHPTFSDQSQYAKGRPAGHWQGDQFIPAAEQIEPGVLGSTQPTIDPVDVMTGGLLGGARGAIGTAASEAVGTGAARTAGAAGLPPWMQSLIGLAAGMGFPLAARGRGAPAEPAGRTVEPEVMDLPPRRGLPPSQAQAPKALPRPYGPNPRFEPPPMDTGLPGPRPGARQIPYDLTGELMEPEPVAAKAPPPLLRPQLPPPRIFVDPEGGATRLRKRTQKVWKTLDEPVISARRTSEGIKPFEQREGAVMRRRVSEPGISVEQRSPPAQGEQITGIQKDIAATRKRIEDYGATNPQIAMESYRQAKNAVADYNQYWNDEASPEFKKWAGVRDELQKLDSHFPTKEQLLDATFEERLNRQIRYDRDAAQKLWRQRGEFKQGSKEYFGRAHGALQVEKGDLVKTKWGTGRVLNNPPRPTSGKTGSGKPQGLAGNWRAKIELADGTVKHLTTQQFLRLKDELNYPGQLTPPATRGAPKAEPKYLDLPELAVQPPESTPKPDDEDLTF